MLTVETISAAEHLAFVRAQPSVSFLQTPAWAAVKPEWTSESVGWRRNGELVGAALVLYRQVPRVKRYLAYLPEGPDIDWTAADAANDLADWLDPLAAHAKRKGAFGLRIGPPVVMRRWDAQQIKDGIADPEIRTLGQIAPRERNPAGARLVTRLRELGWTRQGAEGGFAAGQPAYNFQIPLAGRDEADVLAGMNQLWRRNIKKADKLGVVVDNDGTVDDFHAIYVETAERDRFTPRPASYFHTMVAALSAEEPDRIRLYFARHEGDLVASTIAIRVGEHAWYSYGASTSHKRDVRGSNAIQWRMIRDAMAAGATVYDLRGITDTLDADDPHVGLIQFKVGTGGEAVEYAGEWDLPLNRLLYKAFDLYMSRR